MSGSLTITFAPDMPAATVEVVSPDLEVVQRVMLDPGRSTSVQVPSEASFLRVHLPSGQVVTLKDPGNLTREEARIAHDLAVVHLLTNLLPFPQPRLEEARALLLLPTDQNERGADRTTHVVYAIADGILHMVGTMVPAMTIAAVIVSVQLKLTAKSYWQQ